MIITLLSQNYWSPFISLTEIPSYQTNLTSDDEKTLTNYKFLKTYKHLNIGLAKDIFHKITTLMACVFLQTVKLYCIQYTLATTNTVI